MTVKSDRWIRRMAEEAQLIHPFEARLVREIAGTRIISAGASSYGYDMRLADDGFRVFSPIHGREIDPKHFDDECLIEPPLRIYVNEGIGQVVFLESDEDCDVSYEDRGGKYQGQTGLTYSRL